jgi:recombination protein RecR
LVEKVKAGSVNEVIFALSSTMEGDTTNFTFYKHTDADIVISTIARNCRGDELEYADEVTLGSILQRVPFEKSKQLIVLINN